ncbi:hypothetical protein SAMN05428959_10814 [Duganella sp. CF517]|uniref:hypothetical protein n=1 Tax=Duganella sp. CF517 TaxID=1881038 RepID=UPI0008D85664|nr:hypothetical protein [Duganella sp. CF517]SEO43746.1 hypothetical protein SAMN05428959_10814 [Duganella sp. CF517]
MNDRELTNAALLWHTAHARRLAVGKEKRRLDAKLKAGGDDGWSLQRSIQQSEAGRQVTELKRKELAALRALARVCAKQRGHLQAADVIDVDGTVVLLAGADDQLLA